jgi:hypothetical protein
LVASLLIGAFQLISLGIAKGFLLRLTWQKKLQSCFETLALGAMATAAGYAIGLGFPQ